MKPLNREWHRQHAMDARSRREERVAWHAEHAQVCGCREVPASLKAEVAAALRRREPGGPAAGDASATDLPRKD